MAGGDEDKGPAPASLRRTKRLIMLHFVAED
jgi:hypothetical protein